MERQEVEQYREQHKELENKISELEYIIVTSKLELEEAREDLISLRRQNDWQW